MITHKQLVELGACSRQADLFRSLFGDGVEPTAELAAQYADKFNWDWAARHLLRAPAWAEYERVDAQAWAEYKRVKAQAWAEYERVKAPALAEYKRVDAQAWAKYTRVAAQAFSNAYMQQGNTGK